MDLNAKIDSAIRNLAPSVKRVWNKHKLMVLAAIAFVILSLFGGMQISSSAARYASVVRQRDDLSNSIEKFNSGSLSVETVTSHIDHGLDTSRWESDDRTFLSWIYPAFYWSNSDEYNANRELFVQRFGPDDDFVTSFMPAYYASYIDIVSDTDEVDDGTRIACRLNDNPLKSYVTEIDESTGRYSYVALISGYTLIPSTYASRYFGELPIGRPDTMHPEIATNGAFTYMMIYDITPAPEGSDTPYIVSNFDMFSYNEVVK